MNHYLLPLNRSDQPNTRYGTDALPTLLRRLQLAGASPRRLEARVYGGGQILVGDADIGLMNIAFADQFLRENRIAVVEWDVGGGAARWVDFHPASGQCVVRSTPHRTARDVKSVNQLVARGRTVSRP